MCPSHLPHSFALAICTQQPRPRHARLPSVCVASLTRLLCSRGWPGRAGAYEGDIKHGKKHGKGVMKFRNGDIYTGSWENNMINGEGTMVYSNGEKYHGLWVNDR
jgi:hypothetical protein